MKISKGFIAIMSVMILFFGCEKEKEDIPEEKVREFEVASINPREITQLPEILMESSGIYIAGPNRIWSHNDAGNLNELYCVDTTGQLLRTLIVSNASNIDWEDLAVDSQGRLYINDAGNNGNDRQDLVIYRIPNPETVTGDQVEAERINFVFEDQTFPPKISNLNYDIEGIIWKDDSIFMFTKDRSSPLGGYTKMYSVPATPGQYVAKLLDSLYVDNSNHPARITGADFNPNTGELVLLTRTRLLSFTGYPGNRFFDGHIIDYQYSRLIGQTEAVAFLTNRSLYITSEGAGREAGHLYEIILP